MPNVLVFSPEWCDAFVEDSLKWIEARYAELKRDAEIYEVLKWKPVTGNVPTELGERHPRSDATAHPVAPETMAMAPPSHSS